MTTGGPLPQEVRPRTGGRVGSGLSALLLIALLGLITATALGRILRAPPGLLTAIIAILPYLYAALSGLIFAVWCLLPDRKLLPVVFAGALGAMLILWGPSWPARVEEGAGNPLTVVSWNVRRLWGWGDETDPMSCISDVLETSEADIIAFQEVSKDNVLALCRLS